MNCLSELQSASLVSLRSFCSSNRRLTSSLSHLCMCRIKYLHSCITLASVANWVLGMFYKVSYVQLLRRLLIECFVFSMPVPPAMMRSGGMGGGGRGGRGGGRGGDYGKWFGYHDGGYWGGGWPTPPHPHRPNHHSNYYSNNYNWYY